MKVHLSRVTEVNYVSADIENCKKGLLEEVRSRSCDEYKSNASDTENAITGNEFNSEDDDSDNETLGAMKIVHEITLEDKTDRAILMMKTMYTLVFL